MNDDETKIVSAAEARGYCVMLNDDSSVSGRIVLRFARTVIALHARAKKAEAERDEARKMLGECYVLSGADTDGNKPGSGHLWSYAVQEVRQLREDYDEGLDESGELEKKLREAESRAARYRRLLERGLNLPARTPQESKENYHYWVADVRRALEGE